MPVRPIAFSIAAIAAPTACQQLPAPVSASVSTGTMPQACSPELGRMFGSDAQTSVVLIKQFEAGKRLVLPGANAPHAPSPAKPICLVKLNVNPGNPGPAGEPSTSGGIGIEIRLPAHADSNSANFQPDQHV